MSLRFRRKIEALLDGSTPNSIPRDLCSMRPDKQKSVLHSDLPLTDSKQFLSSTNSSAAKATNTQTKKTNNRNNALAIVTALMDQLLGLCGRVKRRMVQLALCRSWLWST